METETKKKMPKGAPASGAVYGLGLIGAAVYFISQATGFWIGVLGFLKALVWPAFLVYEALKYFGA
ncbi:MAG TPA: hypothetical protein PKK00_05680 [Bacteroidales bacterium]|mgnify:CR=1 FL=1|nr:hypothetical protein [Bacteroidales bacterium]HPS16346.1 hypothetical protein [Bacteroidales bacterium]